jgi:hypothetical protein
MGDEWLARHFKMVLLLGTRGHIFQVMKERWDLVVRAHGVNIFQIITEDKKGKVS